MQQLPLRLFKVQRLPYLQVWCLIFSRFYIPKIIKIGSFLTELLENTNTITFLKRCIYKQEVAGKLVRECLCPVMHAHMYPHTDGQTTPKHNASSSICWMGGSIIKTVVNCRLTAAVDAESVQITIRQFVIIYCWCVVSGMTSWSLPLAFIDCTADDILSAAEVIYTYKISVIVSANK